MLLRYERKYLVPYSIAQGIRDRIAPFVVPDKHCRFNEQNMPEYTVRSIYFDTLNLDCHQEKTEGVELRKKFRIRCYGEYVPGAIAKFEIKRKIENRIKKHKAFTQIDDVEELLATSDIARFFKSDINPESLEDAQRFFFHLKKRNLRPTVLVTYEREAYQGLLDPGVRITFDKNIRSYIFPTLKDFYREEGLKHLFPYHFILEIKYFTDNMPTWAKSLVQEYRLRNDALSKYTIGYDVHSKLHFFNY